MSIEMGTILGPSHAFYKNVFIKMMNLTSKYPVHNMLMRGIYSILIVNY